MSTRLDAPGRELRVDLPRPVPPELAPELARRVYFVSEAITGFQLLADAEGAVHSLVLQVGDAAPAATVERELRRVVDDEVLGQLARPAKVVWRSARRREPRPDTFERLLASGEVTRAGEGQVALGGAVLELVDRLDALVRRVATDELGAQEWRYPTLIPTGALQRSGYFDAFPQHVMLATRLPGDAEVYRRFVARAHGEHAGEAMLALSANADYCLPPTMCYHTFHQHAGSRLTAPTTVFTARGKSFRYESRYHASLERLWDFTIREVVFLGERERVAECRERFLRHAMDLVDALGLDGRCEVASDPFFCARDTSERVSAQRLLELKYELRLVSDPDATIAVGSFNLHEQHFGEAFGIVDGRGHPVHSGCVGFGLERLGYAVLCQYGFDPAGWPDQVRG